MKERQWSASWREFNRRGFGRGIDWSCHLRNTTQSCADRYSGYLCVLCSVARLTVFYCVRKRFRGFFFYFRKSAKTKSCENFERRNACAQLLNYLSSVLLYLFLEHFGVSNFKYLPLHYYCVAFE